MEIKLINSVLFKGQKQQKLSLISAHVGKTAQDLRVFIPPDGLDSPVSFEQLQQVYFAVSPDLPHTNVFCFVLIQSPTSCETD